MLCSHTAYDGNIDGICYTCGETRSRLTAGSNITTGNSNIAAETGRKLGANSARRRRLRCTRKGDLITASGCSRHSHFLACCAGSCSSHTDTAAPEDSPPSCSSQLGRNIAAPEDSPPSRSGQMSCNCAPIWKYNFSAREPQHHFGANPAPSDEEAKFPFIPSGFVSLTAPPSSPLSPSDTHIHHISIPSPARSVCSHPRCIGGCLGERYFIQAFNEWIDDLARPPVPSIARPGVVLRRASSSFSSSSSSSLPLMGSRKLQLARRMTRCTGSTT